MNRLEKYRIEKRNWQIRKLKKVISVYTLCAALLFCLSRFTFDTSAYFTAEVVASGQIQTEHFKKDCPDAAIENGKGTENDNGNGKHCGDQGNHDQPGDKNKPEKPEKPKKEKNNSKNENQKTPPVNSIKTPTPKQDSKPIEKPEKQEPATPQPETVKPKETEKQPESPVQEEPVAQPVPAPDKQESAKVEAGPSEASANP